MLRHPRRLSLSNLRAHGCAPSVAVTAVQHSALYLYSMSYLRAHGCAPSAAVTELPESARLRALGRCHCCSAQCSVLVQHELPESARLRALGRCH